MPDAPSVSTWHLGLLELGLVLAGARAGYGQARDLSPISTGRPDQTTGTTVIPRHTVQLESGLRYQHAQAVRAYNYPVLMARYGLLDWLELRISASVQDSVATDSRRHPWGVGPPELGTRLHLWQQHGLLPEAALTAAVTLPVGPEALRPDGPETRLRIGLSNSLSDKLTLTYTYGYGWLPDAHEQKYAAKLGVTLSSRLSAYGEFFGTTASGSRPDNEADAGLLWLLSSNLQVDVAAGLGLTRAAPAFFVTTGFSIRLPR
jgi:hypothetical protein